MNTYVIPEPLILSTMNEGSLLDLTATFTEKQLVGVQTCVAAVMGSMLEWRKMRINILFCIFKPQIYLVLVQYQYLVVLWLSFKVSELKMFWFHTSSLKPHDF